MYVKGIFWQNLETNLFRPLVRTSNGNTLGSFHCCDVGDSLILRTGSSNPDSTYTRYYEIPEIIFEADNSNLTLFESKKWGDSYNPAFTQDGDNIILNMSEFDNIQIPNEISVLENNAIATHTPCSSIEINYQIGALQGDVLNNPPTVTSAIKINCFPLVAVKDDGTIGKNPINKSFTYDNEGNIIAPKISQRYRYQNITDESDIIRGLYLTFSSLSNSATLIRIEEHRMSGSIGGFSLYTY